MHIRLPSSATGPIDHALQRSVVKLLPEDLQVIIYGMQEWSNEAENIEIVESAYNNPLISMPTTISILLGGIRGIIDDRRVRYIF